MRALNGFLVLAWLPLIACGSKDETDDTTDETAEVGEQESMDEVDSNTDVDADEGDVSGDTGTDEEGNEHDDGVDAPNAGDPGPEDEASVPDFEVEGVYDGEFSVTLTIDFPAVVATCSGDVTFIVDEMADPNISGTGSCSFDAGGGLAPYVALGLLDDLGPFEGETTGEVLERPNAAGALSIDTSIGEISPEWTGTFADATESDPASFAGDMVGTVDLDLSDVVSFLSEVSIEYDGSFETTRTGDVPEGEEDTGGAELP